jgi:hypothetical protein
VGLYNFDNSFAWLYLAWWCASCPLFNFGSQAGALP